MEEQTDLQKTDSITLSRHAIGLIYEASKWAKFISIVGFIFTGFMVIAGLGSGIIFSAMPSEYSVFPFPPFMFSFIYLLISLLYFFPIYYLFNFASKAQNAIKTMNGSFLDEAFKNLKSHYKFMGILTIIVLALYALGIIIAIFMGAFFMNLFM